MRLDRLTEIGNHRQNDGLCTDPCGLRVRAKNSRGVVDGVAGRAQYIANERRVEDRKIGRSRSGLAQHITYKD